MEAKDQDASSIPQIESTLICTECMEASSEIVAGRGGEALCAACVATFYVACAQCSGLIPSDEALDRQGLINCSECYSTGQTGLEFPALDQEAVDTLVEEYLALHAEEKRIGDRMDEIKEQLKQVASAKPRVANAVTLRTATGAVKCSYSVKIKCDSERVAALEPLLGQDAFAALFESKVTYSPHKQELEALLASTDEERRGVRETVISAIEKIEVPTLSVVRRKK